MSSIIQAIKIFEFDQYHRTIYDDANELIEGGFPAEFLLPLIRIFTSDEGYQYYRRGELVDEMIGISHAALVYAIAKHLGVPSDTGSRFTGDGFRLGANIDAIRKILDDDRTRNEKLV